MKKTNWHIVSYPRSGNHIVRTLMEAYSGRPTLGCPESPKDTPIFEKPPNKNNGIIKITNPNPIGYKAHRIWEVLANQRNRPSPQSLLLITRDPAEAISSHLARSYRRKGLMLKHADVNRETVKYNIDQYMGLVLLYQSFDGPKIHIKFQDIIDERWHRDNLLSFVSQVTGETPEQLHSFEEIMAISKDSQVSLRQDLSSLKGDISAVVSEFIDYETVLKFL